MDLFDIVISGKIRKEGGGDVSVDALNVTENGTYTASSGHAYSPVTVSVPQGVFPSGTLSITSNGVFDVGSFASADVNVSGGGDTSIVDGLIERSLSSLYNVGASKIASSAFYSYSTLVSADFLGATNVGAMAFYHCDSLKTINLPEATYIGMSAFTACASLESVSIPNVNTLSSYAFSGCCSLAALECPKVKTISAQAFYDCVALSRIWFSSAVSIYSSAFRGCTGLTALYLLSTSIATLRNVNALTSTPMSDSSYTGSFGSIYVPASLVSDYKAANNWSAYADRITSYVEG